MSSAGKIAARLLYAAWSVASRPHHLRFVRSLRSPAEAQERLLRRILRENATCSAGRRYDFASINSIDAFRSRVPLVTYDDIASDVDAIRAGQPAVLTSATPSRLVPTGGTTRASKLVPFTAALSRDFSRAVGAWLIDLAASHPGLTSGPAYWSVSPAMPPPDIPSVVPVGFDADAAYLGRALAPLVRRTLVAPDELARARPIDAFQYATLRLLLGYRSLRFISVWHPSFLSILLDHRAGWWGRLVADVRDGTVTPPSTLPDDVQRAVVARCRPAAHRASDLERAGPEASVSEVWPEVRVVSAWGDAAAEAPFASLTRACGSVPTQPKGLLATEACVTIPFRGAHPCAVDSTVVEFIDNDGQALGVEDVRDGGEYDVAITTAGGLYRYRLGDRVRVDGHVGATPSLRLVGRSDQVVDLVGEKLSAAFVTGVLTRHAATDFALLAVEDGQYALYVGAPCADPSALLRAVDVDLRRNPAFAYAQDLGQLAPLRVVGCGPDAAARYIEHRHTEGQSLGDVKPASLAGEGRWTAILGGSPIDCTTTTPAGVRSGNHEREAT